MEEQAAIDYLDDVFQEEDYQDWPNMGTEKSDVETPPAQEVKPYTQPSEYGDPDVFPDTGMGTEYGDPNASQYTKQFQSEDDAASFLDSGKQFKTSEDAESFLEAPTAPRTLKYPPPPNDTSAYMVKPSWKETHPTLYAAAMTPVGTAKEVSKLIPYMKYIYPEERKKFNKLKGEVEATGWWAPKTKEQAQTRRLLYDLLDLELWLGGERVLKAVKPYVGKVPGLKWIGGKGKGSVADSLALGEEEATTAIAGETAAKAGSEKLVPKSAEELRKIAAEKGPVDIYGRPNPKFGMRPEDIPSGLVKDVRSEFQTVAERAAAEDVKAAAAGRKMTEYVNEVMNAAARNSWTADEAVTVQRFTEELFKFKPQRAAQEAMYTAERAKRIGPAIEVGKKVPGEAGYHAQLKKLAGKMKQVDAEALRNIFSQKEVDNLFNVVRKSATVQGYDAITAQRGLGKALMGDVPTNAELRFLSEIFPKETIDAILSNRSIFKKAADMGLDIANVPRSIMASMDLSAPFRQGIYMLPSHPIKFMKAFTKMFGEYGSEKAYKAAIESLASMEHFQLGRESGLALTDISRFLGGREERFMSPLAEKIPVIGRQVRASERAYTAFLNKLRMDTFNDLITKAQKAGFDPYKDRKLAKAIADLVNNGTGRGSLSRWEKSATTLNTFFFSPRLMASRLNILNPWTYINPSTPAFVRKEALKHTIAFAGMIGTILGMAQAGGMKVGTDIRSADFGKVKVGNTRLDFMGGFQQYIRAAGQLYSGEYKSSVTDKVYKMGEGYKPITRKDIVSRQIRYKLAPAASFVWDMLGGIDEKGNPISVPKEIGERFVPMVLQDLYDLMEDDPDLLPLGILPIFGVGMQTYK